MLLIKDKTHGIDIVGRACRLPGASDIHAFWELLKQGQCAVTEIGPDRWSKFRHYHPRQGEPGKSYSFAAGILDDIWGFDPGVFNISPREAEQMDPQQRLLLQIVWEALEDAGLPPSQLAGQDVGVYVGASGLDHGTRRMFDPATTDAYFMTGNTLSLLSNRISYIFDFHGPSFTVDTACSSSLVALNEAVQALATGRIETAIVAGVNALLTPFPFIGFSAAHMLSPEGLCRPFDANGMGYVRAEGCVAMVLQRQDVMVAKGQRSYAQIVKSDVNSDGRTTGVALPSADFQADLLKKVYQDADVTPEDLAFVEAHGTGTRVGDPAEAQALGSVLGQKRSTPLPIGSVKSNIGHLEPASGLAGLLKAILAFEHNLLPASLHFDEPNPDIPFESLNLKVNSKALKLKPDDGSSYAGISTFGFGGTNAHVIIERADPKTDDSARASRNANQTPDIILLSAQSRGALKALAKRYQAEIESIDDSEIEGLSAAAFHYREKLPERLVVTGDTAKEMAANLADFIKDKPAPNIVTARAANKNAEIAFVYSGNGSQWVGMGRLAFEKNVVFCATLKKVDKTFKTIAGWSLVEMLYADDLDEQLKSTKIAQPLLFGIQVALGSALRKMGLEPSCVLGHSVGEIAAAHTSGALTLKEAANVIHKRSLHQEIARSEGTMAAVMLAPGEARKELADKKFTKLEVAAINSKRSVTISGRRDQIEAFVRVADDKDIICKLLDIDYPFHSALIDPVRQPLLDGLVDLKPKRAKIPFISTVEGTAIDGKNLSANYWWNNVRQPVQFADAIEAAIDQGARVFVEIGPRAVLHSYIADGLSARDIEGAVVQNFHSRNYEDVDPVRLVFANALAAGAKVDDAKAFATHVPQHIKLPHYAWQNQSYRVAMSREIVATLTSSKSEHPLTGWRLQHDGPVWNTHLDPHILPYLRDHKVNGKIVVPGAVFAEMALSAGSQWFGANGIEVRDMDIVQPMVLSEDHITEVKLEISPDTGSFEIASRARLADDEWQIHAVCRIAEIPRAHEPELIPVKHKSDHDEIEREQLYAQASKFGLDYGPAFKQMLGVEKTDDTTLEIWLKPCEDGLGEDEIYGLHPTVLDACFHGLLKVYPKAATKAFIPIRFGTYRIYAPGRYVYNARISVLHDTERSIICNFALFAEDGSLVATLNHARFKAASLVEQPQLNKLAYHHEIETIALPGYAHRATVPGIAQIVKHAGKLSPANVPQKEEAKRLLEAAAQRAAYDAVQAINQSGLTINPEQLVADGRLKENRLALFCALVLVLEDAGLATPNVAAWSIVLESGLPDVDIILQTILNDHPDRLSECTLLSSTTGLLTDVMSGQVETEDGGVFAAATLEHFASTASGAKALVEANVSLVRDVVDTWEKDRPLCILELGLGAGALTRALAPIVAQGRGRLIGADTNKKTVSRLKLALADNPDVEIVEFAADSDELSAFGPFDLLVSANGLHMLEDCDELLAQSRPYLAPGALIIAVEPRPDAFHDVVFGFEESWFCRSASPVFPLGALRSSEEWLQALKNAGFYNAKALPIATDDGTANLLLAKAEKQVDSVPTETEAPTQETSKTPVLLIAGEDGEDGHLAEALETVLHNRNHHVIRVKPAASNVSNGAITLAPEFVESWIEVFKSATNGTGNLPKIVHLDGAFAGKKSDLEALRYRAATLTAALQALGQRQAQLWIIAPGGARAISGNGQNCPVQSGIWSYARTATNEYGNADIRLIDFDDTLDVIDIAERTAAMVDEPGVETEVIFNRKSCSALRVRRGKPKSSIQAQPSEACVLGFAHSGTLDQLKWLPKGRVTPKQCEVEIEIAATGLNFRDVMWTLGMLPEEALEDGFAGPTLGFECSGRIVSIGKGVKEFDIGDHVIAFAPACFSSHVTVTTAAVARMPNNTDLMAAATIPVAFLTAYYALHNLGKLKKDEWVLIHGGAGGVGLAALQIALWCGANVITTAGSGEKREFLKMLGSHHVFDSRSLDFSDQVLEVTGGQGVDVVLNSLSGEAMERSIELVRPFGRFLELGKRDYYANTKIGLRPFRRNISYFGIDADQLLVMEPKLSKKLFQELVGLFEAQEFSALPYRQFAANGVIDAYRLMQQSGHIGKIIVTPPQPGQIAAIASQQMFEASSVGAHVIVGGLGGLGLKAAEWLADSGAQTIVLTSRSGKILDDTSDVIVRLQKRGVDVRVEKSDVTDHASLTGLLDKIREQMPIKGIIHAAMVIDDVLIQNMKPDQIEPVLAPKVAGAENLDLLTRKDKLDYFVLFSSVTTMIGNPGQAIYVAANAYLEGLARARRAEGLPALAVGWGAITDAGYLARETRVGEMIASRTGGISFSARDALDMLSVLLVDNNSFVPGAVVTIAPMDWSVASQDLEIVNTRAFTLLAREASSGAAAAGTQVDLVKLIADFNDRDARDAVAKYLGQEVAHLLRLPEEDVNLQRPLADIGIDSLMVFELRTTAQKSLGISIPIGSVADGATLNDIAGKIVARIRNDDHSVEEKHDIVLSLAQQHGGDDFEAETLMPLAEKVAEREKSLGKIL